MKSKVFIILLIFTAVCVTAQTKRIEDLDGRCTASVPSDWSLAQSSARSPDKTASVVLISTAPRFHTIADLRKHLVNMYKDDKVIKDSASELEMQGTAYSGKPNFLRAIPVGGRVCFAEVVYVSGKEAEAQQIIESLRAAH